MAMRIALVVLAISGVSYLHLMSQLADDTQAKLLGYISERGQREEQTFVLAEDNHALLREDFVKQFEAIAPVDWKKRFDQHFLPWSDGTVRDVPEGTDPEKFDTETYPTSFIGQGIDLTADFQKRMTLSYELVERYGAGWRNRFLDTYISLPEGAATTLWPGVPWGIKASPNLDITTEEWAYLGDVEHNPERETVWTGVYADPVSQDWMVSAETPIDSAQHRHLATIGHDIILTNLIARTIEDHLEGTYNLLIRVDGQLIAHPTLMDQIRDAAGKFNVQTAEDPHLQRIFDFARGDDQGARVIYNRTDQEYLAIAKLQGPNWYLVTVYPEVLLRDQALGTTWFLLGLGLCSLVVEVGLLFIVLRQKVAAPLQELLTATQQLTANNFEVKLNMQREDELGQLAAAFTHMAQQLRESFSTLEERVKERTAKLEDAKLSTEKANADLAKANDRISQLNHQLKSENLRMGAELDVVRQMQQLILPKDAEMRAIEGLDISGYMTPAKEVGGDYYDVLYQDGVVTLGIGDVTGHGLESGILMIMTQTAVRTLKEIREYDPVRFLDTLNRTLYKNIQRMNCDKTLTLAILNYANRSVSISGQHEETIVVRADGRIERVDTIDLGFPIGLDDEITAFIDHVTVPLETGDGIVLYTDGITEATNPSKQRYGLNKLCEVISQHWHRSAIDVRTAIVEDVCDYIGDQTIADDITLLVLKQE